MFLFVRWRRRQSSMAIRMASGARLLHSILYSGMPPNDLGDALLGYLVSFVDVFATEPFLSQSKSRRWPPRSPCI